jgi:hypothetical protein
MGTSGLSDFFQEKVTSLMQSLEFVRTYLDNLLIILSGTYDNHLKKLEKVLTCLQLAGLCIDVNKSSFALHKIDYLGNILTRDRIKPQLQKVSTTLVLKEPTPVTETLQVS